MAQDEEKSTANLGEQEILQSPEGRTLMSWESEEFIQYERTQGWYVGGIVLAVICVLYSIFTGNYLFTLIIGMIVAIVYLYTQKQPVKLKIELKDGGLKVNDDYYPYEEDLLTFWIFYKPPELKTLSFARRGFWRPNLVLQVGDANPLKIRDILLSHLPEDIEKEEGTIDQLSRNLKF